MGSLLFFKKIKNTFYCYKTTSFLLVIRKRIHLFFYCFFCFFFACSFVFLIHDFVIYSSKFSLSLACIHNMYIQILLKCLSLSFLFIRKFLHILIRHIFYLLFLNRMFSRLYALYKFHIFFPTRILKNHSFTIYTILIFIVKQLFHFFICNIF